jgi:hypothetical protein
MKYPRSPYAKVGGIVYFGRMVGKIRLQAAGELPEGYEENLGKGFDKRCVNFLRVSYEDLATEVRSGLSDEEVLDWCFAHGRQPDEEQIEIWNEFMRKRGWNDSGTEILLRRKQESGLEGRDDIVTMFDYLDADEGRPIGG